MSTISLALIDDNDNGNVISLNERPFQIESRLDMAMIELWADALKYFKSIGDENLRFAKKFEFVNSIKEFMTTPKKENNQDEEPF